MTPTVPHTLPLFSPDPGDKVKALIEQEMGAMVPRDYLAHLPAPPALDFPENPMLAAEMRRMEAGQRMQPLDVSRYEVAPPEGALQRDPSAWRAALANARSQLEHQHNRLANLELLGEYGPRAHLQQNAALAACQVPRSRPAARALPLAPCRSGRPMKKQNALTRCAALL